MISPSSRKPKDRPLPIGRQLALTSKAVAQAFSTVLGEAGGSISTWLILSALVRDEWRSQQDLAVALGIEGPTLTHHLDALERQGLVVRVRDTSDRRAVRVEPTPAGHELHARLLDAAMVFDRRLRSGLSKQEVEQLRELLQRVEGNLGPGTRVAPRQM